MEGSNFSVHMDFDGANKSGNFQYRPGNQPSQESSPKFFEPRQDTGPNPPYHKNFAQSSESNRTPRPNGNNHNLNNDGNNYKFSSPSNYGNREFNGQDARGRDGSTENYLIGLQQRPMVTKTIKIAQPAIKATTYEVHHPAIQKQFYDIEERVLIKPAGTIVVELEHPIAKIPKGQTILPLGQPHPAVANEYRNTDTMRVSSNTVYSTAGDMPNTARDYNNPRNFNPIHGQQPYNQSPYSAKSGQYRNAQDIQQPHQEYNTNNNDSQKLGKFRVMNDKDTSKMNRESLESSEEEETQAHVQEITSILNSAKGPFIIYAPNVRKHPEHKTSSANFSSPDNDAVYVNSLATDSPQKPQKFGRIILDENREGETENKANLTTPRPPSNTFTSTEVQPETTVREGGGGATTNKGDTANFSPTRRNDFNRQFNQQNPASPRNNLNASLVPSNYHNPPEGADRNTPVQNSNMDTLSRDLAGESLSPGSRVIAVTPAPTDPALNKESFQSRRIVVNHPFQTVREIVEHEPYTNYHEIQIQEPAAPELFYVGDQM